MELRCFDGVPKICSAVASVHGVVDATTYPSSEQLRKDVIKLDLLYTLSRRRMCSNAPNLSVFTSADSSPQHGYDWLA
eukprot:6427672-Pyramimonas_sp.AAC.1